MFEGLCIFGEEVFRPLCELFQPMQHAYGDLFPADGTAAAVTVCLLRRQAQMAVPVSVQVIFSLLREKLKRSGKSLSRFQRFFQRRIRERRVDEIALSAEFCGRMRVRIGDHRVSVEHRHSSVHQGIG